MTDSDASVPEEAAWLIEEGALVEAPVEAITVVEPACDAADPEEAAELGDDADAAVVVALVATLVGTAVSDAAVPEEPCEVEAALLDPDVELDEAAEVGAVVASVVVAPVEAEAADSELITTVVPVVSGIDVESVDPATTVSALVGATDADELAAEPLAEDADA